MIGAKISILGPMIFVEQFMPFSVLQGTSLLEDFECRLIQTTYLC